MKGIYNFINNELIFKKSLIDYFGPYITRSIGSVT